MRRLQQSIFYSKKLLIVTTLLFITAVFMAVFSRPVLANGTLTRNIKTSVEVTSDSSVHVTQTHKLSWDDETRIFPASKNFLYVYIYPALTSQENSLDKSVTNIRVVSKQDTELSFTKSVKNGALQIKVPYYQDLTDINALQFVVTYDTSLYVSKEGGITEIHYPGLSKDAFANAASDSQLAEETIYSLEVKVKDSFGAVSFMQPDATTVLKKGAVTTYTFTTDNLIGKSLRITMGTKRLIKFKLFGNISKTNESSPEFLKDVLVNYVDIALPTQLDGTEFANQAVFYSKIEPYPVSLRTDEDGNIIARIPVSATRDSTIAIEGFAAISLGESNVEKQLAKITIDSLPVSFSNYLKSESQYWQADDPQIQAIALKNIDMQKTILGTVKKTLSSVSTTLNYPDTVSASSLKRQGALMALSTKKGVCMEYADLMLSILRAQKIATRTVFGDGIGSRVDRTIKGIGHQWVGVYFPGIGWIPVDPTWSDKGKEYIGADFDHFVWYVASKSVSEPAGFDCLSWDGTSPCREALQIDTEPVNSIPTTVFTISDIRQKLELDKQNKKGSTMVLQRVVTYLGASKVGRLLLSTSGLILLFALALYIALVNIVSIVGKVIRKGTKITQPPLTTP